MLVDQSNANQVSASHLRFEIAVNISKFVELIDCREHLADVKPRVLLFQDSGIVEQRPEVTPRHILHCKVDMVRVLEGVQQANQPRCLGGGQDISFNKYVSDL